MIPELHPKLNLSIKDEILDSGIWTVHLILYNGFVVVVLFLFMFLFLLLLLLFELDNSDTEFDRFECKFPTLE